VALSYWRCPTSLLDAVVRGLRGLPEPAALATTLTIRRGPRGPDQQTVGEIETKETVMAAKHKVTVSAQPAIQRASSAQQRAAQVAMLSTMQADLKREAAERRAKRALSDNAPATSMPPKERLDPATLAGQPTTSDA
jgi:hypothetical protein